MKIAILAWGSLIWQPKDLLFDTEFSWKEDGPILPIEFARISKDGRLTLVITQNGTFVPTLYSLSKYETLDEAIINLAVRESSGRRSIGSYEKSKNEFSHNVFFKEKIVDWMNERAFGAVIWTNLGENWNIKNESRKIVETIKPDERIEYLKSLKGNVIALAEEYIRKTPFQIKTKYRAKIEEELNWKSILK
jgi:hypothetical protein